MNRKITNFAAVLLAAALAPAAALAHPALVGQASGFANGLAHPLSGLDHVLAMVMVGVFAVRLGGRASWLLPATFVAVMAAGGALGAAGIGLPFVELGIALSVIVLGAVVALDVKAPVAAATAAVGFFAIFHGHAHGAEMPETAAGLAYGAGFVLATAALHLAGIGLGVLAGKAGRRYGAPVTRWMGSLTALAGLGLLAGVF